MTPETITILFWLVAATIMLGALLTAWAATIHDRRVHTMTAPRPMPRIVLPARVPADTGRHHLTPAR